jgi:hypothetical protein
LALSQEVYEYLEELDEMNWSAWGNVLNQYLRNTSIGTTVNTVVKQDFAVVKQVDGQVKSLESDCNVLVRKIFFIFLRKNFLNRGP